MFWRALGFGACLWIATGFAGSAEHHLVLEKPQTGLLETQIAVCKKIYQIEVAITPQQEQMGLMYRTHLPKGHGMLFPFNPPRRVSFWMKNTKIPLDMLFVGHGQLLHVFEDVQPCEGDPCAVYGIEAPVEMVLELPAGTAHRDHLKAGDPVLLKLSLEHLLQTPPAEPQSRTESRSPSRSQSHSQSNSAPEKGK